ncbi:MAG: PA14 domain-containing protein [Planctomycetota bacterium]
MNTIRNTVLTALALAGAAPGLGAAETDAASAEGPGVNKALELIQARYLSDRQQGVEIIAKAGADKQEEVISELQTLLESDNWQTQVHAARALGAIGTQAQSLVPGLVEQAKASLTSGDIGRYRLMRNTVVAMFPDKREDELEDLFVMMKTAMEEDDPALFDTLASTLTASGQDAVPELIKLVEGEDEALRRQAIATLAGLGEDAAAAVPALKQLATESERDMRREIQRALENVRKDNALPEVETVSVTCTEGQQVAIEIAISDTDDVVDELEIEVKQQPEHGKLERTGPNSFIYHSQPGYTGSDTFTYVGKDSKDATGPLTATVNTVADTEPPQLVAVHPAGTNLLRVAFNEPVDPVSAGNPANYALNPSVEIVGAEVDADGTSAVIEVAQPLNDGAAYGLTAREIADASEAGNSATLSTEFTYHSRVPGLQYAYYETKDKKAMEAGLKDVEPTATGTTDAIGIDLAERDENYALRFTGMLVVAESGEYTFYTTSDDGSFLSIDGEQVVENGGWHGMQEEKGTVTLEPGPHEFEVYFFQGGGGDGLEVEWKAPGGDKEEIPASVLCHKPGA